jgi:hypothetical protein
MSPTRADVPHDNLPPLRKRHQTLPRGRVNSYQLRWRFTPLGDPSVVASQAKAVVSRNPVVLRLGRVRSSRLATRIGGSTSRKESGLEEYWRSVGRVEGGTRRRGAAVFARAQSIRGLTARRAATNDEIASTAPDLLTVEEAAVVLATPVPRCGTGVTVASGRPDSGSAGGRLLDRPHVLHCRCRGRWTQPRSGQAASGGSGPSRLAMPSGP